MTSTFVSLPVRLNRSQQGKIFNNIFFFFGFVEQLHEIRKTSFARIACDNGDALDSIQLKSMEIPGEFNPIKRCTGDEIPRIDLSFWEE
jgi:hypothetical protein